MMAGDPESYEGDLRSSLTEGGKTPSDSEAVSPDTSLDDQALVDALKDKAEPEPEPEAPEEPEEPEDYSVADEIAARRAAEQVPAPEHWPAEDKQFFASLPDDAARERVLSWRKSVEKGAQEKFDQAAAVRKELEAIDEYLTPWNEQMRAAGLDRATVTRGVFDLWASLQRDPMNSLAALAEQYGRGVAGQPQAREFVQRLAAALQVEGGGAAQPGQAQPENPMAARIAALEQQLEERQRAEMAAQHQATQRVVADADARLKAFADAKDEGGNPKHPHFEAVKPLMGAMIQAAVSSGEVLSLEDAYSRAVWSRDDLRDDLLKARQAEAARASSAASRAAVERARSARTPKSASVPSDPDSEDDLPAKELMRRQIRAASGGTRV